MLIDALEVCAGVVVGLGVIGGPPIIRAAEVKPSCFFRSGYARVVQINAAAFRRQCDQGDLLVSLLRDGLDRSEARKDLWFETERLIVDA